MFQAADQKLKEDLEKQREKMMARMGRLKTLRDNPATGWQDFIELLDTYIAYCKDKKISTKLDTASPAVIEQLRFMDNYVSALEWVRQIPTQYIKKTEDRLVEIKKSEETNDPAFI